MLKRVFASLLLAACPALAAAQTPPATIPAAGGPIVITPLMHASVQIEHAGRVVLVDPAMGDILKMKPADLILVTDIHEDHFNAGRIARFRKPGAALVVPAAVRAQLPADVAGPVEVFANGQSRTVASIPVEAVAAYNIVNKDGDEPFHTKGRGNGYVITIGGKRLFFAGDTECVPEIKALQNIDVAFLPMNLPFTMSPEDAAACALAFKPKTVVPYHWMGGDPAHFHQALAVPTSGIEVLKLDWYPPIERPDIVAIQRPGALIDLGGHTLHLHCTGRGSPTVILDAGDTGFALDWMLVQPEVAKSHRVCSYDRPGRGWSAPGPPPVSDEATVTDLHAALIKAGERPPFVVVGAETGANAMRLFQIRFSSDVAGAVFVDGFHEDGAIVFSQGKPAPVWSVSDDAFHAEIETMRPPAGAPPPPMPPPSEDTPFDRLLPDVLKTRVTFEMRTRRADRQRTFDQVVAYFDADRAVLKRLHEASVRQPPQFGDRPLIVLRTKQPDSPFTASMGHLAQLSTKGIDRAIDAPASPLHLSRPEAVVAAINEVATIATR